MVKKDLMESLSTPQGLDNRAITFVIRQALEKLIAYDSRYKEMFADKFFEYTKTLEQRKEALSKEFTDIESKISENNKKMIEALVKL